MSTTTPPPHLAHEWSALSETEREDILRWARQHSAAILRERAKEMTRSISATPAERSATYRAADHLAPEVFPDQHPAALIPDADPWVVTVADPANPTGTPLYQGHASEVGQALPVGTYPATTSRGLAATLVVHAPNFSGASLVNPLDTTKAV